MWHAEQLATAHFELLHVIDEYLFLHIHFTSPRFYFLHVIAWTY